MILGAILVWAGTLAVVLFVQWAWPREADLPAAADAIVCLGAANAGDGSPEPGDAARRRAETCVDLHLAGVAPVILFTGAGNEAASNADAMASVARARGVSPEAILVEPEARSTIQNAAFGLRLLPDGASRLVLVTDAFHLPRSWVIFRFLHGSDIALYAADRVGGQAETRSLLRWSLRESVAIWYNVARLAVYAAAGVAGVDHETRIGWFN